MAQIGIEPDLIMAADIDESPKPQEIPRLYALRMAEEKALAVLAKTPKDAPFLILSADTVVLMGRRILPKAETDQEVRDCLSLMSGRAHQVLTAICVAGLEKRSSRLVSTRVQLKRLTEHEIDDYVASQEGLGKAGGYGIQGRAGAFVRALNGSFTGVVGLPLFETRNMLTGRGYRC